MKTLKLLAFCILLLTPCLAQPSPSGSMVQSHCPATSEGRSSDCSNYYYTDDYYNPGFYGEGTPAPSYANESSPPLTRTLPGYDTHPRKKAPKQPDYYTTRPRLLKP